MKKEVRYIYDEQKEISLLKYIETLLDWDKLVYMPENGNVSRAEQMAFVSKEVQKRMLSEKLFREVKRLRKSRLKGKDKIVVDRLYKDLVIARKLPLDFVEESSRVINVAYVDWVKAKQTNNFNLFKPHLKKIIELKRKQAEYIKLKGHPYNSLFYPYEEGMTVEKIKPLFEKLKYELIKLLNEIKKSKKYNKEFGFLKNNFSKEKQTKLSIELRDLLGLKDNNSRVDISVHPFSLSVGGDDTRITYYLKKNPMGSFLSIAHETGHAFYDLNYPKKYKDTFVYDCASIGLHESQSRFWENMVCKSKGFWSFFYPKFKREFKFLKNVSSKDWYDGINKVKPSFIRSVADEITYCLHIILRFELELGLIEGKIKVEELPRIWNHKMKEYLGVNVKKDSDGVLQDVHWSDGSIGYFATYAIGSIYAAQLYEKMVKEHPEYEKDIKKGRFDRILKWLNKNVHRYGKEKTAEGIIKRVCGEGLNSDVYIKYLRRKYLDIYK